MIVETPMRTVMGIQNIQPLEYRQAKDLIPRIQGDSPMNKPQYPSVQVRNLTLQTGSPKICVSISDRFQEDILASCRNIVREGADLVEWRVDCYRDFNNDFMVEDTLDELRAILGDTPLILTLRTVDEGGKADVMQWDYIRIYREAARTGNVDIFDIEYNIMVKLPHDFISDIKRHGKIIVSKHYFEYTPSFDDLVDDIIRLQVAGGDIAKLAVMPEDETDVARLVSASKEILAHHRSTPIITISMGLLGVETRVKCNETGSCLTFAAVGLSSAPGQLPISELRELLEG